MLRAMPLRPEDRRLAAYLVESEALSLEALLPALGFAMTHGEDLAQCLIQFSLLDGPEVERLRAEADGHSPRRGALDGAFGQTLITDIPALLASSAAQTADAEPSTSERSRVEEDGIEVKIEPTVALPSQTVDRYQLIGEIGRGGMGRILRAKDAAIGREVAVKVMLEGRGARESEVRRFWMEVQATGQLEHPAIVPVHDVGRLPSGELFYVMKLLSGRTLAEILAAIKAGDLAVTEEMTRTRLLTVFQQLAYAVAFSHSRGVIHRDIKPANIMIGRYGEVTLLDWGLAKLAHPAPRRDSDEPPVRVAPHLASLATADGTITGTPQYMSPEAVDGRADRITEKVDVWGLGAVLYEILTLTPAFLDEGFMRTLIRVRSGDFPPPRKCAPERAITLELEELCLRAMHSDPDRRPTAKSLADDIGRILEGTRERERRQTEARARTAEGRAAMERWRSLKEALVAIESNAARLAKEVPPWAPVSEKRPLWSLEDEASQLKLEAIGAFEEAEAAFLRALGEVEGDREARGLLAALYYERFTEAERSRDSEGQRYFSSLVARHDDGAWAKLLAGVGRLTVRVDREAEVRLAKLASVGRVLTPIEERSLGLAPIEEIELSIGSYQLTIVPKRGRPVLRPVLVDRLEAVEVEVKVRDEDQIGSELVLVPEGRAILGGDPVAHGALERRVVFVGEFAIARYPVTCGEYLEFVNALARSDLEAARRRVPRVKSDEGYYWQWDHARRSFEFPPRVEGKLSWAAKYPVFGVSFDDAIAYAEWRSKVTGQPLRLPREDEWEKAARGVDGRFFPWGDHFDPTFCKMKDSRPSSPEPEPVGTYSTDRSPYGACDLAGGVRELCIHRDEHGVEHPVMRGGCWHDSGLFCRVAFRHVTKRDFVNTGLGFRLAKDIAR
jgi:eukaryotic-like serine/threonine-protein kinase